MIYGCESWTIKKAECWRIDAFELLEKTLESPLDCKEIQPVNPKGNQPWIFIGRTDVEAEVPILWPPDMKNWLTGKDPDAGKDWRQEGGAGDDRRCVGWMASPTRWTWVCISSGIGDGQGVLVCCGLWGHEESDMTERLNWTDNCFIMSCCAMK